MYAILSKATYRRVLEEAERVNRDAGMMVFMRMSQAALAFLLLARIPLRSRSTTSCALAASRPIWRSV